MINFEPEEDDTLDILKEMEMEKGRSEKDENIDKASASENDKVVSVSERPRKKKAESGNVSDKKDRKAKGITEFCFKKDFRVQIPLQTMNKLKLVSMVMHESISDILVECFETQYPKSFEEMLDSYEKSVRK